MKTCESCSSRCGRFDREGARFLHVLAKSVLFRYSLRISIPSGKNASSGSTHPFRLLACTLAFTLGACKPRHVASLQNKLRSWETFVGSGCACVQFWSFPQAPGSTWAWALFQTNGPWPSLRTANAALCAKKRQKSLRRRLQLSELIGGLCIYEMKLASI